MCVGWEGVGGVFLEPNHVQKITTNQLDLQLSRESKHNRTLWKKLNLKLSS